MRHNVSLGRSRKVTMAIGSFLLPVCLFIVSAPLNLAILFFGAAFFGRQFWSAILQTLTADLFTTAAIGIFMRFRKCGPSGCDQRVPSAGAAPS
jgi:hypothetical protein